MRNNIWKGLRRTEWLILAVITSFFLYVIFSRYEKFACRSMESEVTFSLGQIYSAQKLYFEDHDKYAPVDTLLYKERRLKLNQKYYEFVDGISPTQNSFMVKAIGKPNTLVENDIWYVDEHNNIKNNGSCLNEYE